MQHIFGYARVSATDQNLDTQLDDLTRAGCSRIFQEKVSGTRTRSLALDELLAAVREGDVVVVARGRRYFSNEELTKGLRETSKPSAVVSLGRVPSAEVYVLDAKSAAALTEAASR